MTPLLTIPPVLGEDCATKKRPLNPYEHTDHETIFYTAPLDPTVNMVIVAPSQSPVNRGLNRLAVECTTGSVTVQTDIHAAVRTPLHHSFSRSIQASSTSSYKSSCKPQLPIVSSTYVAFEHRCTAG